MIISSIHDTDMQLKYDQVKKVKNRAEFYIFRFFCFVLFCFDFFVRPRPKVELGLVRLIKISTFGLSLIFDFFLVIANGMLSLPVTLPHAG